MDSRVVAPLVSPQVSSTNGFRGPGAGLLSPSRKSGYHIRLHRICRTATPESILSEPEFLTVFYRNSFPEKGAGRSRAGFCSQNLFATPLTISDGTRILRV